MSRTKVMKNKQRYLKWIMRLALEKQNNKCTTVKYFLSYFAIHFMFLNVSAATMEQVKWLQFYGV